MSLRFEGLQVNELRELATPGQEFIPGSRFDEPAIAEHVDKAAPAHCGKAVRNDEHGHGSRKPVDRTLDLILGRLDVDVPDSEVLHVPVELRLKLVAVEFLVAVKGFRSPMLISGRERSRGASRPLLGSSRPAV